MAIFKTDVLCDEADVTIYEETEEDEEEMCEDPLTETKN